MPDEIRDEQITIRIPKRFRDLLDAEATRERRSIADIVIFALEARYPGLKQELPHGQLLPKGATTGNGSRAKIIVQGEPRKKGSKQ